MKVEKTSGTDSFLVSGADGRNIEMYNAAGIKVAEVAAQPAGDTLIDMSGMAGGVIYSIRSKFGQINQELNRTQPLGFY